MGMSIFQFEDDKIKEAWIAFDTLNPALQIGVIDVVFSDAILNNRYYLDSS